MSLQPERNRVDLQSQRSSTDSLSTAPAHDVPAALAGAVFPLSAEQLVRVARENEAPGSLLTLLSALPRRSFDSLENVAEAVACTRRDTAGPASSR
jgi:Protein of unknown function (DUF2795)